MALVRVWDDAVAKAQAEGCCRKCFSREMVECAHIAGRKYDQPKLGWPKSRLWVNPDHIIPLCKRCHMRYDAHELDILPLLTPDEQAEVVRCLGIISALRRTTSKRLEE